MLAGVDTTGDTSGRPAHPAQDSLFDDSRDRLLTDPAQPRLGPFQHHSMTSRQAAIVNYPRNGTQRQRIIKAVASAPDGLTREQLAEMLGIVLNAVLPRVVELRAGGWIEESGRTRLTKQGARATVLVLTERARTELAHDTEADGGPPHDRTA
jgi:hypothetical protein